MRPNSKASALVLLLAGLLARTTLAAPHALLCPSGSDVTCGEVSVTQGEQWHGDNHLIAARAGIRPPKRPRPDEEGDDAGAGPSKRPETDPDFDPDGEQSGAISGPAWGQSTKPQPDATPATDVSAIPNIEDKGYIVKDGVPDGNDLVWKIHSKTRNDDPKDEGVEVATIRTNKDEGSITVDDAKLDPDNQGNTGDPKGKTDRARLWEMEATAAIHKGGMSPTDIKQLRFEQVYEERSVEVVERSREKMGGGLDYTVRRDSELPTEKEVFDDNLNNSGFGKNTQAFLAKVPTGKQVTEIHVGPGTAEDDFSYTFILG
ncbi:hypothetical protein B0H66DRAFT_538035 [Apodospora peruviana]|uniref:Uncharacterized protein n=1 Tax=Apodospora peruviana TaxID=516989 RepID=A0AAE0LYU8_9PEZI|nr:hypothetical protein B0H66DRAFT_538035 [Apodospora peruviana]